MSPEERKARLAQLRQEAGVESPTGQVEDRATRLARLRREAGVEAPAPAAPVLPDTGSPIEDVTKATAQFKPEEVPEPDELDALKSGPFASIVPNRGLSARRQFQGEAAQAATGERVKNKLTRTQGLAALQDIGTRLGGGVNDEFYKGVNPEKGPGVREALRKSFGSTLQRAADVSSPGLAGLRSRGAATARDVANLPEPEPRGSWMGKWVVPELRVMPETVYGMGKVAARAAETAAEIPGIAMSYPLEGLANLTGEGGGDIRNARELMLERTGIEGYGQALDEAVKGLKGEPVDLGRLTGGDKGFLQEDVIPMLAGIRKGGEEALFTGKNYERMVDKFAGKPGSEGTSIIGEGLKLPMSLPFVPGMPVVPGAVPEPVEIPTGAPGYVRPSMTRPMPAEGVNLNTGLLAGQKFADIPGLTPVQRLQGAGLEALGTGENSLLGLPATAATKARQGLVKWGVEHGKGNLARILGTNAEVAEAAARAADREIQKIGGLPKKGENVGPVTELPLPINNPEVGAWLNPETARIADVLREHLPVAPEGRTFLEITKKNGIKTTIEVGDTSLKSLSSRIRPKSGDTARVFSTDAKMQAIADDVRLSGLSWQDMIRVSRAAQNPQTAKALVEGYRGKGAPIPSAIGATGKEVADVLATDVMYNRLKHESRKKGQKLDIQNLPTDPVKLRDLQERYAAIGTTRNTAGLTGNEAYAKTRREFENPEVEKHWYGMTDRDRDTAALVKEEGPWRFGIKPRFKIHAEDGTVRHATTQEGWTLDEASRKGFHDAWLRASIAEGKPVRISVDWDMGKVGDLSRANTDLTPSVLKQLQMEAETHLNSVMAQQVMKDPKVATKVLQSLFHRKETYYERPGAPTTLGTPQGYVMKEKKGEGTAPDLTPQRGATGHLQNWRTTQGELAHDFTAVQFNLDLADKVKGIQDAFGGPASRNAAGEVVYPKEWRPVNYEGMDPLARSVIESRVGNRPMPPAAATMFEMQFGSKMQGKAGRVINWFEDAGKLLRPFHRQFVASATYRNWPTLVNNFLSNFLLAKVASKETGYPSIFTRPDAYLKDWGEFRGIMKEYRNGVEARSKGLPYESPMVRGTGRTVQEVVDAILPDAESVFGVSNMPRLFTPKGGVPGKGIEPPKGLAGKAWAKAKQADRFAADQYGLGPLSDAAFKVPQALHMMRNKGVPLETAAETVWRGFGDYHVQPLLPKILGRTAMPFVQWSWFSFGKYPRILSANPAATIGFGATTKEDEKRVAAETGETPEEVRARFPEHIRTQVLVGGGEKPGNATFMDLSRATPKSVVEDFVQNSIRDPSGAFSSAVGNPVVSTGVEAWTGRDRYGREKTPWGPFTSLTRGKLPQWLNEPMDFGANLAKNFVPGMWKSAPADLGALYGRESLNSAGGRRGLLGGLVHLLAGQNVSEMSPLVLKEKIKDMGEAESRVLKMQKGAVKRNVLSPEEKRDIDEYLDPIIRDLEKKNRKRVRY